MRANAKLTGLLRLKETKVATISVVISYPYSHGSIERERGEERREK